MTGQEVELAIRKAHIINKVLLVTKLFLDKLPLAENRLGAYLLSAYINLIAEKDAMKTLYKQLKIELQAPDQDLVAVFNEAENLVKSSFPYRCLGFLAAMRPDRIELKEILKLNPENNDAIIFSYQLFKEMLENPNDEQEN